MRRLLLIFFLAICLLGNAQVSISKTAAASAADEMFMDMAVTAAMKSVASKGAPAGAVVVLNGAWKGSGIPVNGLSAEENAIAATHRQNLEGAAIYTINFPSVQAINAIIKANISTVYYVNGPEDASAANDDANLPVFIQIDYQPAADLLK